MKKSTRIHYLQHVAFEGLGCIDEWVRNKGHRLTATRFYLGESLPDPDSFDWLIVMGGPMGIYDEAFFPWLTAEKQFLKKALADGKVILGICLGAQLLADALGVQVISGNEKEIGWFPVKKTPEASKAPLLSAMPDELTVFHWHGDQFQIPPGATRLAESKACANQLFLYGDRVAGLQFHFEATPESIEAMLEHAGDELKEAGPFIQTKENIRAGYSHCPANNKIMFSILDRLNYAG
ncbi:type 1 glutamine amidotransferase [Gaoshiqia sp. Z1-71]|uniref:type 1 glutamine amidotransferase n=1 Tax=Gaoshiqia hydrogeniformans TaxID=3290090 RepID=UPI003BF77FC4